MSSDTRIHKTLTTCRHHSSTIKDASFIPLAPHSNSSCSLLLPLPVKRLAFPALLLCRLNHPVHIRPTSAQSKEFFFLWKSQQKKRRRLKSTDRLAEKKQSPCNRETIKSAGHETAFLHLPGWASSRSPQMLVWAGALRGFQKCLETRIIGWGFEGIR